MKRDPNVVVIRRLTTKGGLCIPSPHHKVLILDTGCDQGMIALGSCLILNRLNIFCKLSGCLMGDRMVANNPMELVNAATKATLPDGSQVIFVLNQHMLDEDPQQTESLLNPHQARAYKVRIDDTAGFHWLIDDKMGKQRLVVQDRFLPLHFDGHKMFFSVSKPTIEEWNLLERYELMSPAPFEPQSGQMHSCRVKGNGQFSLEDW